MWGKIAFCARIILAVVFIFSGFVKGIDPTGSALKFTEYFNAFGMAWLVPLSLYFSIGLSTLEMVLGLSLMFKLRIALSSALAVIFMLFFTALTLLIAITNPVSDCGCFGDAIKLSNWNTFFKNIFLLFFALIAYFYYKTHSPRNSRAEWIMMILVVGMVVGIFTYSYLHLPLIDMLPYKTGTNIPEAMKIPEGATPPTYITELHYKNKETGKIHTFTAEDTTWYDQLIWEFVDSKTELKDEGYIPPIKDFSLFDSTGDVTDSLMQLPRLMILTLDKFESLTPPMTKNIGHAVQYARSNNYSIICITTSALDQTPEFDHRIGTHIPCYNIDATILKTMIRSKIGFILLDKGTIVAKWSQTDMPKFQNYKGDLQDDGANRAARREVLPIIAVVLLFLVLYVMYRYIIIKK